MPGYRKKSKAPDGCIEVREKKRFSIKKRNTKYYRYDRKYNYAGLSGAYGRGDTNVHNDQYDTDNSSSISSIVSCTYAHTSSGISLGRKLNPVYLKKQKSVLKLSRFYHHSPVPCRNIWYSLMKMRQQSGANLKRVFYTKNQREERKERHQENLQVLVVTPMSSEAPNDYTIGTPRTRVPQGNVPQKRQDNEMHSQNFPELLIAPTADSDTISTHGSEFPKMDDGPQQRASTTNRGSGDQSAQAEFTVDFEMPGQMRSVSFLICALFTVLLGRFKDVLFALLPHGGMILGILASVILLNCEMNSNIGEYFERVYQFVIGLIDCMCW